MAIAIFTPFLRHWRYWGATRAEVQQRLPGDEMVPNRKGGYTQAITIRAARKEVWLWVAQLGQDRCGFYSYEFLENLVGCDIHNIGRVVQKYQHDEKSPGLKMHPKMPPMPLVTVEAERVLLFGGRIDPDTPVTWLFYLDDADDGTRLVSRWLFSYRPSLANAVAYYFFQRIAWVMGRKMLLGIKRLAEGNPHSNGRRTS